MVAACSNDSSDTPAVATAPATSAAPAPATTAPGARSTTGGAPAVCEAPGRDAFYVPPDPLPAGEPGDVIWSRPFAGPGGAQGFYALYLSTTVDGQPIAVSGVVIAPGPGATAAPPEGRTVVTW